MPDGFASFLDALHSVGDRRFTNQQRTLQTQQDQMTLDAQRRATTALPGIGQQLMSGDYDGAQIAAAVTGNKDLASTIKGLSDDHRTRMADMYGTIGGLAGNLLQTPLGANGDLSARQQAFDASVPALRLHGLNDAQIAAARADLSDAALNGYFTTAQTVKDLAAQRQHLGDQAFEIEKARETPYTLAPGDVRYGGQDGHVIASSPWKPEVQFVDDGSGRKVPVTVNFGDPATGGGIAPSPASAGMSRPQRNNNPGNVKALSGGQMWRGQTGTDPDGFAIFGDVASGQRAADRNLASYGRQGVTTLSQIISRWAPAGDRNNTAQYIQRAAAAMGVDPNQPLDLSNPQVRQALLTKGIFPNEGAASPAAPAQSGASPGISFSVGQPIGGEGSSAGGLTQDAINQAADFAIAHGGKVPAGYARNKAAQVAITNAVAERAKAAGMSSQDVINHGQDFLVQEKALKDFATGAQGNTVRSLNVSISHLAQLHDAMVALNSGNTPGFNHIAQWWQRQTGSPLPTNAAAIKPIVAGEVAKAVIGGGGALADRQEFSDALSTAGSPAQMSGAIRNYIELMAGQLGGLKQQYETSTGRRDFNSKLSSVANRLLDHGGGTGGVGGGAVAPVRVTSPQQAAALPAGTHFITPDGRELVKH